MKIHVTVEILNQNKLHVLPITNDKSHDSKHFISLVEQLKQFGNVTKTLADGTYYTKYDFLSIL